MAMDNTRGDALGALGRIAMMKGGGGVLPQPGEGANPETPTIGREMPAGRDIYMGPGPALTDNPDNPQPGPAQRALMGRPMIGGGGGDVDPGGIRGIGGSMNPDQNPNRFPREPMRQPEMQAPMGQGQGQGDGPPPAGQPDVQPPVMAPRGRRRMMQGGGGMGGADALAGLHSIINGVGGGGY